MSASAQFRGTSPGVRWAEVLDRRLNRVRGCAAEAGAEADDPVAQAAMRAAVGALEEIAGRAGRHEAARTASAMVGLIDRMMTDGRWDRPRISTLVNLLSTLLSPDISPRSEICGALAEAAAQLAGER